MKNTFMHSACFGMLLALAFAGTVLRAQSPSDPITETIAAEEVKSLSILSMRLSGALTRNLSADSVQMILIPCGTFRMGNITDTPYGEGDEKPVHEVTLSRSFLMSRTEVTQAQWKAVMGSISQNIPVGDSLPIVSITWYDVIAYCNRLSKLEGLDTCYTGDGGGTACDFTAHGYRLPTEAEWEYACRGGPNGDTTDFYTGNMTPEARFCSPIDSALDLAGWYCGNDGILFRNVGLKAPNKLGLFDMHGNVWEWCWDSYSEYKADAVIDPVGPVNDRFRVLRGGSFRHYAQLARSSHRIVHWPSDKNGGDGFRLARTYDCVRASNDIINALGSTSFCDGDSVILDAGAGNRSYRWSNGASTRTICVDSTGTFFVDIIDTLGCSLTSSSITVTAFANPRPVIAPYETTTLCEGDSVVLDAGAGFTSYKWSDGATMQTITVKTAGSFVVTVTNSYGCSGVSEARNVLILQRPATPTISQSVGTLRSSSAVNNEWFVNDTLIPSARGQITSINEYGPYRVRVTDENGCSAESAVFFPTVTSVLLSCPPDTRITAGEIVSVPLVLTSSMNLNISPLRFDAHVRFTKSVLSPKFSFQSMREEGNDRIVIIHASRPASQSIGVLIDLPFIVMLGDSACATVHLDSLTWRDGQAQVTIQNTDCNVCASVCREGGARLFHSAGNVDLLQNRPNPFNAETTIEYQVIERTLTRLVVVDVLGRTVATLVEGPVEPGRHVVSFDASSLASGVYFSILQTPARSIVRTMSVMK